MSRRAGTSGKPGVDTRSKRVRLNIDEQMLILDALDNLYHISARQKRTMAALIPRIRRLYG